MLRKFSTLIHVLFVFCLLVGFQSQSRAVTYASITGTNAIKLPTGSVMTIYVNAAQYNNSYTLGNIVYGGAAGKFYGTVTAGSITANSALLTASGVWYPSTGGAVTVTTAVYYYKDGSQQWHFGTAVVSNAASHDPVFSSEFGTTRATHRDPILEAQTGSLLLYGTPYLVYYYRP